MISSSKAQPNGVDTIPRYNYAVAGMAMGLSLQQSSLIFKFVSNIPSIVVYLSQFVYFKL